MTFISLDKTPDAGCDSFTEAPHMMKARTDISKVEYRLASRIDQRTKLVITDVDGTLASFWDYFVPALRDFLRQMSQEVKTPISELAEDIGRVVERHGTHEYPWLLEETGFAWRHYEKDPELFVERYVKPFWKTLDENRKKYLRPFPETLSTLAELKRMGIKVVALSDAPDYMARIRNKQVFDGLLDAVYALETVEPPKDSIFKPISLEHGRQRLEDLKESTDNLKTRLVTLPKSYEKPCPSGLDMVLEDFEVYPYEALFIGDSLKKDGLVAASRGIRFIWAHYGSHLPAEYEELVLKDLKPADQEDALVQSEEENIDCRPPIVEAIAARYDELLNHV